MRAVKTLFLIIVVLFSTRTNAQEDGFDKDYFQIDLGVGYSFHPNAPIDFFSCWEGCILDEQSPRYVPSIGISYLSALNKRFSLKIGLIYSKYSHLESGRYITIQENVDFLIVSDTKYLSIYPGIRYIPIEFKNALPYLDFDLIFDWISDSNIIINDFGYSYQFNIGVQIKKGSQYGLILSSFYKAAILPYDSGFGEIYMPYTYGLKFGCRI